ncbi:MAG TPA: hypothetical protein VF169_03405 [Albitalea sp.]|uniref:hypothetical protein n=1 Tax=Piscinibacter sp. TaxID=1903157 RepID=UPI002ED00053
MNHNISRLTTAVSLCLPLLATAQGGRADPADAQASGSASRYQSAFSDYKPWQEIKPVDWRAVNDNVRDAAGDAMPAPAAPAASAPTTKSPMPSHGGHQMHGGRP